MNFTLHQIQIAIAALVAVAIAPGVRAIAELSPLRIAHKPVKLLAQSEIEQVSDANPLTNLATDFINLLVREDWATAVQNFDETLKAALPASKLQEGWQSLDAQFGKFKRQLGVRLEKFGNYDVAIVTCEFDKGVLDVAVVFSSDRLISGLKIIPNPETSQSQPPAYVNPDAFTEQEVILGSGDKTLPGTLTVPMGNGPFPAVVLVHGSGPNDRDESFGPNKPFRDLAWGLASQGIAVLRYDKRTKVHPDQFTANSTVKEESIDDAIAAASLLRQTAKINPEKVYVLGHSLGGMVIPRIGTLDPNLAGLIILAANTRPLEDLIVEQTTYIASIDGEISAEEKARIDALKQQVAKVKDPQLSSAVPAAELPLGIPAAYWLDLRDYNPSAIARNLQQPMLILQGERDYQVTMVDFQIWQQALASRQNVTFKSYPDLNHLFIPGSGKSNPGEYLLSGHVAETVINDIVAWIKK